MIKFVIKGKKNPQKKWYSTPISKGVVHPWMKV